MKKTHLIPLVLSFVLSAASAGAATDNAARAQNFDGHFLSKLHQANLDEIELGKLVKDKAQSQQVKDYGQKLVDDHSKNDDQLKSLAKAQGIDLNVPPTARNDMEKRNMRHEEHVVSQLRNLSGPAFDARFKQFAIHEHSKDIREVQNAIPKIQNPQVKDFAKSTVPTLQNHEQLAKNLNVQAPSGMAGSAGSNRDVNPSS